MTQAHKAKKIFRLILIKPSHYDDDGYVIQWMRSAIPSNTLATLFGLAKQSADAASLGDDVEIDILAYDETNTVLPLKRIVKDMQAADAGFVGLVGVQSNQFPRALDIARNLRAADVPVVIGGFHVSGCLSMLPEIPEDIQEAIDLGISIYAGEAEGRLDEILIDARDGALKPVYNYMNDLPDMADAAIPYLPHNVIRRTAGSYTSFDSGRGCPFQCSFCTIINVQGRKSRYRTADDIEAIIRTNAAQGINRYFVTDDNFARNKNWEEILDRLIKLREVDGMRFKFIIQVDTLAYRSPGFIEKATRAGAHRIFIGLENINPDNLAIASKRQNKIWEYRTMLQAWKDAGAMTYAGYILGFPGDTPESVARDIEILKKELPLDLVEFFILTALPGSADHQRLYLAGEWLEPDMNKYDLEHVTTDHPTMNHAEVQAIYDAAWKQYYTDDHMETIIRRGAARGIKPDKFIFPLMWFAGGVSIEGIHPLEAGYMRRKVRRQRRSTMPLENPFLFYPRRIYEIVRTHVLIARLVMKLRKMSNRVSRDHTSLDYSDDALQRLTSDQEQEIDLMKTHSAAIPEISMPSPRADQPKIAAAS
jgi:radical SAM superfamily enzyme YgiQ (UPF0313 family)